MGRNAPPSPGLVVDDFAEGGEVPPPLVNDSAWGFLVPLVPLVV